MIKTWSKLHHQVRPPPHHSQRFHRDPQPQPSKFLGFAVLNSPGGPGADCSGNHKFSGKTSIAKILSYFVAQNHTLTSHPKGLLLHPRNTTPVTRQPPLRRLPWQDWQPLRVFLFRRGSPGSFSKVVCTFHYISIQHLMGVLSCKMQYFLDLVWNVIKSLPAFTQKSIHQGYPWIKKTTRQKF